MSRFERKQSPSEEGNGGKSNITDGGIELNTPKSYQSKSLFVHSLSDTVTAESLTELFSQSYPLKHSTVVRDSVTKQSKGYGFVTFADAEDAKMAMDSFNGSLFEGRKMKIKPAEPRQRSSSSKETQCLKRSPSVRLPGAKNERRREGFDEQRPTKLIIRNLPWTIKEPKQLADLFQSYGKVKHATLPAKKPGLLAGFGFVVLRGRRNAENALKGMNGKTIEGRVLAVDWAVEKNVWETTQSATERGISLNQLTSQPSSEPPNGHWHGGVRSNDDNEDHNDDHEVLGNPNNEIETESEEDASAIDESDLDSRVEIKHLQMSTCFIRNLPFNATDEILREHFSSFGPIRYARVVLDSATERSRGTGFVCFYRQQDADTCLRESPRVLGQASTADKGRLFPSIKQSLLEDFKTDSSGRYTLEGRVLQVSRAVDKSEAARLTTAGSSYRDVRDRDRKRLYLLSEGTIPSNTPLYGQLESSEMKLREDSVQQRRTLLRSNPSLNLSLTRLSVRNLSRNVTSKSLKALAREAVVGFARDVKAGLRDRLSREELSRGGAELRETEKARKVRGKGIVRQAKIVFEGREGKKVSEESGAGRSRGYGFIEYTSHRWALMGLRWLNGYAIGKSSNKEKGTVVAREEISDKKKRLIVEFAIENAQVVGRRQEKEAKARERSMLIFEKKRGEMPSGTAGSVSSRDMLMARTRKETKRKRDSGETPAAVDSALSTAASNKNSADTDRPHDSPEVSKRQRLIGKKRMIRRSRKGKEP